MESAFYSSQYFRNRYGSFYWERLPEELTIDEKKYQSTENLPYELIISTGKYIEGEKVHECIIREIIAKNEDLGFMINDEVSALHFQEENSIYAKAFGFCVLPIVSDLCKRKYTLIFKNYQHTLFDYKAANDATKVNSIREIIECYKIMHEQNWYHGSISLDSFHFGENHNFVIGNFMRAGIIDEFQEHYNTYIREFDLANLNYASPEILFISKCVKSGVNVEIYNPSKSDIFSLGLTILSLYGIDIQGMNELDINPSEENNKVLNYYSFEIRKTEFEHNIKISQERIFKAIDSMYSNFD